jgi:hypothetical protein
MFAPEQAELVGWKWKGGYQSHFVTTAGVLIPTCNVSPWAKTKEEMLEAERKQVVIIEKHRKFMKEEYGVDLQGHS